MQCIFGFFYLQRKFHRTNLAFIANLSYDFFFIYIRLQKSIPFRSGCKTVKKQAIIARLLE